MFWELCLTVLWNSLLSHFFFSCEYLATFVRPVCGKKHFVSLSITAVCLNQNRTVATVIGRDLISDTLKIYAAIVDVLKVNRHTGTYVYWTVHHRGSWVKRDQLDATCFIITLFSAQHVSDVNTSILRSLRLICWVISWVVLLWFDWVLVLRCGLSVVGWYPYAGFSLHTDTTPP